VPSTTGRVLLPAHDGLAQFVAAALPAVDVVAFDAPADADAVDASFYCLPYLGSDAARALMSALPSLAVVQSLSIGVDDVLAALPAGVVLCNGRGLHHEESTAELAVLLMLASLRGLPRLVRSQDRREWRHERGESLDGRRVLLVGHGAIGQAVEVRLRPFGAVVTKDARTARGDVAGVGELPSLARAADVLVVCLPLSPETRGLVGADVLGALPDGALVVNVGRGPTIDAACLRAELATGRLRAALDVTDPEPLPADAAEWALPNVLVTPHVGGDTTAFVDRARGFLVDQVRRHVSGEPLRNVVS
jgi:phosphoglycerate dehydrogenase-like enzyme